MASKTAVKIDKEFASLCPALAEDERKLLEESLVREGCLNPLVIWKNRDVLLDGHNRHAFCTKHKIDFTTVALDLVNREEAKNWIIAHQLSRRNLTPEATSYLRGRRYNAEKQEQSPGRPEKGDQTERVKTDKRLAQEYKVGEATIRRDGKFAAAVDGIAENCGDDVRALILARNTGLSRGGVNKLARMTKEKQHEAVKVFKETKKWPRKPKATKPQAVKSLAKSIAGRGVDDVIALIRETAKLLKVPVKDLLEQAGKAK